MSGSNHLVSHYKAILTKEANSFLLVRFHADTHRTYKLMNSMLINSQATTADLVLSPISWLALLLFCFPCLDLSRPDYVRMTDICSVLCSVLCVLSNLKSTDGTGQGRRFGFLTHLSCSHLLWHTHLIKDFGSFNHPFVGRDYPLGPVPPCSRLSFIFPRRGFVIRF